jgi:hypothetical protein
MDVIEMGYTSGPYESFHNGEKNEMALMRWAIRSGRRKVG